MVYCDRSMIYLSSVDTTNIPKTTDYIFSLMDKIVEEIGKENIAQVVMSLIMRQVLKQLVCC